MRRPLYGHHKDNYRETSMDRFFMRVKNQLKMAIYGRKNESNNVYSNMTQLTKDQIILVNKITTVNINSKAFFPYFTEIEEIFLKYEIFLNVWGSNPRSFASKAGTHPFCQTALKRNDYYLLCIDCLSTKISKETHFKHALIF